MTGRFRTSCRPAPSVAEPKGLGQGLAPTSGAGGWTGDREMAATGGALRLPFKLRTGQRLCHVERPRALARPRAGGRLGHQPSRVYNAKPRPHKLSAGTDPLAPHGESSVLSSAEHQQQQVRHSGFRSGPLLWVPGPDQAP